MPRTSYSRRALSAEWTSLLTPCPRLHLAAAPGFSSVCFPKLLHSHSGRTRTRQQSRKGRKCIPAAAYLAANIRLLSESCRDVAVRGGRARGRRGRSDVGCGRHQYGAPLYSRGATSVLRVSAVRASRL
eukprot:2020467-Pleurochrysis_carterae.AAC.2